MSSVYIAEYSCKPIFAYMQTVRILIRLLLEEQTVWTLIRLEQSDQGHTVCKNDF